MNKNVLEFKNVSKHYMQAKNKIEILADASFSLKQGEICAIIGESGSGKSTLLHIAGLLDKANSGQIILLDQNISTISENSRNVFRLKNLGFIYQYHHLLPDFTALENILMPQIILGETMRIATEKAKTLMEKLNIGDKGGNFPGELSGGQQQRVAIARALINAPQIILADEPTGNLDSANAKEVFSMLKALAMEQKTSVLFVTHSQDIASKSDKIFELKQKQIQQIK
jgi:lipoprotein-releasing system ATP-binding protein